MHDENRRRGGWYGAVGGKNLLKLRPRAAFTEPTGPEILGTCYCAGWGFRPPLLPFAAYVQVV